MFRKFQKDNFFNEKQVFVCTVALKGLKKNFQLRIDNTEIRKLFFDQNPPMK